KMSAALDPELNKPYQFHIVVRVAAHPQLTETFKERLRSQLQDIWREALGDMADVTVTAQHPLLKDIESQGLQKALEGFKEARDRKTHFVLVDLVNESYRIQTGQYDSTANLATPVVRQAETDDREFVARAASRLIERDFGLVGTVIDNPVELERV